MWAPSSLHTTSWDVSSMQVSLVLLAPVHVADMEFAVWIIGMILLMGSSHALLNTVT